MQLKYSVLQHSCTNSVFFSFRRLSTIIMLQVISLISFFISDLIYLTNSNYIIQLKIMPHVSS